MGLIGKCRICERDNIETIKGPYYSFCSDESKCAKHKKKLELLVKARSWLNPFRNTQNNNPIAVFDYYAQVLGLVYYRKHDEEILYAKRANAYCKSKNISSNCLNKHPWIAE